MSGDKTIDLDDPKVKDAIQKAVDEQVQGLKSKNTELINKNNELKGELGELKTKLDGVDLDAVKNLLSKASMDEESKLIAEGKIEEVIQKRTEHMRQEHDKQLKAQADRADKAESYANKFRQSVIQGQIVQAAAELGALSEATADIAFLAQAKFSLDENGKAVAVDESGETVIGKDGTTPLTPKEWVEALRESKPYFWPKANGQGAPGNQQGKGQTDILKPDGSVNLTKLAQLKNENPALAKELAAKHGFNL